MEDFLLNEYEFSYLRTNTMYKTMQLQVLLIIVQFALLTKQYDYLLNLQYQ